jgi:hypothetical protein
MSMWDMMVECTSVVECKRHQPEIKQTLRSHETSKDANTICLFVATNLDSWEADDLRYGCEVMLDVCYRRLDATFYAYLRHMMTVARDKHASGKINQRVYDGLRNRFNVIHAWAIKHIGKGVLCQAVNSVDLNAYVPPSADTHAVYRKLCDSTSNASDQAAQFAFLLTTRGYSAIRSAIIDDMVVIVRDGNVVVPTSWSEKVKFTTEEINLLTDTSSEAIKRLCEVKLKFRGTIVIGNDCPFPDAEATDIQAILQQSLFEAEASACA